MAAVTVAGTRCAQTVPVGFTLGEADRGMGLQGLKTLVFDVVVATTGDTMATGISNIKCAGWIADTSAVPMAVTHSAGTLTFTGTAGAGKVVIWI